MRKSPSFALCGIVFALAGAMAFAESQKIKPPMLRVSYRALEFGAGLDSFFSGGRDTDSGHWAASLDAAMEAYEAGLDPAAASAWRALDPSDGTGTRLYGEGEVRTAYLWGAQAQVRILDEFLGAGIMAAGRRYDAPLFERISGQAERSVLTYRRDDIDVSPYLAVSFPWNAYGAGVDVSTGRVSSFAAKFAIREAAADHFISLLAEFDLGATLSFSSYSVQAGDSTDGFDYYSAPLLASEELMAPAFKAYPWLSITAFEYIYRPRWSPGGLRIALSWEMRGSLWNENAGVDRHYDRDFLQAMRQSLALQGGLAF